MIEIPDYAIIQGNYLDVAKFLPSQGFQCLFADPPDNLGLKYDAYQDKISHDDYVNRLEQWITEAISLSKVTWFSVNYHYIADVYFIIRKYALHPSRMVIWRFNFGQHQSQDLGNGFRPLFRLAQPDVQLYAKHISVPSARQTKYKDKRANPDGRTPDDVWEFPRVCGTFHERRSWIPTQHPEALVERAILLSTQPDDFVIDPFLGSGTTMRVCKKNGRKCIGIEMSGNYCKRVSQETGIPIYKIIPNKNNEVNPKWLRTN